MKTVLDLTPSSRATSKYFEDPTFDAFARDIQNLPAGFSHEEETELFKRIEQGDVDARNRIWEGNQRFVVKVAKLYGNANNINDLIQIGNLGLYQAIEKFDYHTGNKFISFAVWYIRREIVGEILNSQPIKKSNNAKTALKVRKIRNEFYNTEHRYPEVWELQDILKEKYDIEIKDKADLYDITYNSINMSFDDDDEYAFETSTFFNEKTASQNDYLEQAEKDHQSLILSKILSCFKERDRKIIEMSFGLGQYNGREYKPAEIAEEMNLTGERVRQLKNAAVERMSKLYTHFEQEVA